MAERDLEPEVKRETQRKNGERKCQTGTRRSCPHAGVVDTPASCGVIYNTLGARLRVTARGERRSSRLDHAALSLNLRRLSVHRRHPGARVTGHPCRGGSGSIMGLYVAGKRQRRRLMISRSPTLPVHSPNQLWAYSFVSDACANGQQPKCPTVINEFMRECLAIDVAGVIKNFITRRWSDLNLTPRRKLLNAKS